MIESGAIQHYNSNAKINLGLNVLNKRKDGYHNLHSLFVEIELTDELLFTPSEMYQLTVGGDQTTDLPLDENNLITQAYQLIRGKIENVRTEYAIHIKKQIPMGGGLGGGSSNAATTLRALNELWKMKLSQDSLELLGAKLGADIPFFIRGSVQLIEGIGDILTPQNPKLLIDLYFLLIVPPIHIATPWAYGALNKTLQPNKSRPKFAPLSKPMNWELFDNDFERIIYETYPEIRETKVNLQKAGALYAGLSGSGSTVFGVFDNLQKAKSILEQFDQYQTFLTSPVFR